MLELAIVVQTSASVYRIYCKGLDWSSLATPISPSAFARVVP
jgi:hypothetical protein